MLTTMQWAANVETLSTPFGAIVLLDANGREVPK